MHLLSSLQAVAHGSDTVQYFQWRKSRGSSEKLHGAVVDHDSVERTFIHHKLGLLLVTIAEIIIFFLNKTIFWIIAISYYSHILLDNLQDNCDKRIWKIYKFKIFGFVFKYPSYEIFFDLLAIIGIALCFVIIFDTASPC